MTSYEIGRVVGVHGFRVKVELHPENKSPSRSGLEGVHLAVAINSFLSFEIGAGETVIGNITDLDAHETFDADSSDLTLSFLMPRRISSVQLRSLVTRVRASHTASRALFSGQSNCQRTPMWCNGPASLF